MLVLTADLGVAVLGSETQLSRLHYKLVETLLPTSLHFQTIERNTAHPGIITSFYHICGFASKAKYGIRAYYGMPCTYSGPWCLSRSDLCYVFVLVWLARELGGLSMFLFLYGVFVFGLVWFSIRGTPNFSVFDLLKKFEISNKCRSTS